MNEKSVSSGVRGSRVSSVLFWSEGAFAAFSPHLLEHPVAVAEQDLLANEPQYSHDVFEHIFIK